MLAVIHSPLGLGLTQHLLQTISVCLVYGPYLQY